MPKTLFGYYKLIKENFIWPSFFFFKFTGPRLSCFICIMHWWCAVGRWSTDWTLQQQFETFSTIILVWFFAMKTLNGGYNLTKDLFCKPLVKSSMKTAVLLHQIPFYTFFFKESLCVFQKQDWRFLTYHLCLQAVNYPAFIRKIWKPGIIFLSFITLINPFNLSWDLQK